MERLLARKTEREGALDGERRAASSGTTPQDQLGGPPRDPHHDGDHRARTRVKAARA